MPSQARRAWRKLSLFAVTALLTMTFASSAKAVYQFEILGGELEVTGFFRSEARLHFEDDLYINQWVQRFQLEATQTWEEVGIIDELAFTTVIRPEFDVAYYFKGITDNHIGRGATGDTWFTRDLTSDNAFTSFNGFDPANATGGLNKNVEHGIWNARELNNFTVNANGSALPIVIPRDGRTLNCKRCRNVSQSATDIALNRTDSSGDLYPIREAYLDATIGDVWIRLGKQMIVWGKTDNFRLMDIINPVDFGNHYFFDPFEDIRIPQWMLSAQWRPGSIGPLTDTAIQLIWNFDEFRGVGLGNAGGAWAHPFGWTVPAAAMFNTYFTAEPCLGLTSFTNGQGVVTANPNGVAAGAAGSCFNADGSRVRGAGDGNGVPHPSGFGVPLGLKEDTRPKWTFGNTEIGLRFEARLGKVRFALTNYWGYGDTPVFKWDTINYVDFAGLGGAPVDTSNLAGISNDTLWANFPSVGIPMLVGSPQAILNYAANVDGEAGALEALRTHDSQDFFSSGCDTAPGVKNTAPGQGLCSVIGGRNDIVWKKNNTTGLAIDYFEDFTGVVFRIESSITFDELVTNSRKIDFVDESDVIRFSIGMDRPTFIKFLNPNRTFFLSAQIFHTYMMGWEGGPSRGFLVDRHQWIYTFFAQGQYMRDRLTPQGFIVWDQGSNGWISGAQIQYLFSNNWSAVVGGNFAWGGRRQEKHDNGAFTAFNTGFGGNAALGGPNAAGCPSCGKPIQRSFYGDAQNGATAFRKNDEVFFRVQYQF